MKEGSRPEFSRKTGAIEKCAGSNGEFVIVDLNSTIL